MTRVDFYTHAGDKLQAACRIAIKAREHGLRVLILAPDAASVERLDRLLWTTPPTGFIPHCRAGDPLAAQTPVILDDGGVEPPHDDALINLRAECPPFFSRFRRLIEIVGLEPGEPEAGRERWRHYRERGYEVHHHSLDRGGSN